MGNPRSPLMVLCRAILAGVAFTLASSISSFASPPEGANHFISAFSYGMAQDEFEAPVTDAPQFNHIVTKAIGACRLVMRRYPIFVENLDEGTEVAGWFHDGKLFQVEVSSGSLPSYVLEDRLRNISAASALRWEPDPRSLSAVHVRRFTRADLALEVRLLDFLGGESSTGARAKFKETYRKKDKFASDICS